MVKISLHIFFLRSLQNLQPNNEETFAQYFCAVVCILGHVGYGEQKGKRGACGRY